MDSTNDPEEKGEVRATPAAKAGASPAMDFIREYLREHGDTEYAKVREAASAAGHAIFPIMYGRAKTLLGMISEDTRQRRRRRREEEEGAAGTPGSAAAPRRTLRQGGVNFGDRESTAHQLSDFLERFQELEAQRNRFRAALLQVERILREALEETR